MDNNTLSNFCFFSSNVSTLKVYSIFLNFFLSTMFLNLGSSYLATELSNFLKKLNLLLIKADTATIMFYNL